MKIIAAALVLFVTVDYEPTAKEKAFCTYDAFKFCIKEIPDREKVFRCLIEHRGELTPRCNSVFRAHGL